jgi:ribonucleoside-diphosphate reductase alpha chain
MGMKTLQQLKDTDQAPQWMNNESFLTLCKGYLRDNETPRDMYYRLASTASSYLKRPDLKEKFFDIMWKNWLCPSSPVCSNFGATKGLPISCNSLHVHDSLDNILQKNHELGILSKYGAGVGIYLGDVRGHGTQVKGTGGVSDGVMAWAKIYESTIVSCNQGGTRRGSAAAYLPVEHSDIHDFLQMRRPTGDASKRCMNLSHGVCITDDFMHSLSEGNQRNRLIWQEILTQRLESGEPYLFFTDTVNNANPETYKDQGLKVVTSNICNEIYLYTDHEHTFVCCLSSLNLERWDEWKDTDTVELAVYFLDAVMEEYIQKAKHIRGFESAVRFAEKSRALGLGVLGWHSLLQSKFLPFDSFDSMMLNAEIFRSIEAKSEKATKQLAIEYGEPEWCKGYGRRNTHLRAIAPTATNSIISGGCSPGIEPIAANIFVQNSAKGTFIRKNMHLDNYLSSEGLNTPEIWAQISKDAGSVLGIKELSTEAKDVFRTAKEINQFAIIKQAGQRQKWIDQGQSVNLFIAINADPKYIHQLHMEAWKQGLKGLYYCRTESVLRGDLATRSIDECASCSG